MKNAEAAATANGCAEDVVKKAGAAAGDAAQNAPKFEGAAKAGEDAALAVCPAKEKKQEEVLPGDCATGEDGDECRAEKKTKADEKTKACEEKCGADADAAKDKEA